MIGTKELERIDALSEVIKRYSATINGLNYAIEDALPHLDGEPQTALLAAMQDSKAQIAAAREALDAAMTDLAPDG